MKLALLLSTQSTTELSIVKSIDDTIMFQPSRHFYDRVPLGKVLILHQREYYIARSDQATYTEPFSRLTMELMEMRRHKVERRVHLGTLLALQRI